MAYTTHIQQVLAYLKQGGKVLPPSNVSAGIATVPPLPTNPQLDLSSQASKISNLNAAAKGSMPAAKKLG